MRCFLNSLVALAGMGAYTTAAESPGYPSTEEKGDLGESIVAKYQAKPSGRLWRATDDFQEIHQVKAGEIYVRLMHS